MALDMCDTVLLVSQLELSSLRNVVRMLMTLTVQEGMHNKVRVVINRVGSDYTESAISLKKAEETLGKPIFWQVPNDSKAVLGGRVAGEPLIIHAPKSRAQQSLQGLAEALGRRQERTAAVASSGGFFKGIFGGKK
jgi:pilus assembly protein CpaE